MTPKVIFKDEVVAVIDYVARQFRMTPEMLMEGRGVEPLPSVRHLAVWILYKVFEMGPAARGRYFGMDHSSATHAVDRVCEKMRSHDWWYDTAHDLVAEVHEMLAKNKSAVAQLYGKAQKERATETA